MDLHLPYIYQDMDRRGNRRLFVRRYGRKIRIREKLGTPAFLTAYNSAVASLDRPNRTAPTIKPAATATLGWLAASYFGSVEFQRLDSVSQRRRRTIIEECLAEVRASGTADMMRDCPVAALSSAHIKMLRDRRAHTPGTANNRKKYLSAMFGWAVENDLMKSNPARDVRRISYATDGFHTWTVEEVARFVERHPVGTKACLALALLLFLGVRRGDLVKLGPGTVEAGTIRMIPRKTRHKRVEASYKPILPVLADIIARSPTGPFTYLATERRAPFTAAGFGNWFADRCREAKVPGSAHGLRKAGASILAEAGATDRQLMAIYDWTTEKQATSYTRAADRKRLAAGGMGLFGVQTLTHFSGVKGND